MRRLSRHPVLCGPSKLLLAIVYSASEIPLTATSRIWLVVFADSRLSEVLVLAGRFDRALGALAVSGLFALGTAEAIARLDEPMPLLFWLPTLWGGAALILLGGFLVAATSRLSKVLVLLGCAVGFVPSVWTLIMPALLVTLAIRTVSRTRVEEPPSHA